jgi:hypothetical protein
MSTQQIQEASTLKRSSLGEASGSDDDQMFDAISEPAKTVSSHKGRSYTRCCCTVTTLATAAVGVTAVALHYFQPALLGEFNSYFPK